MRSVLPNLAPLALLRLTHTRPFRDLVFPVAFAVATSLGVAPLALAQPSATTPAAPNAHPYAAHVAEASLRFGIPEAWIWSVMRLESAGDPTATSHAGAMGLMQVMPGTYAELRSRYGLGPNAYDPRDSILAGAAYLREMHDRYGSAGFLAAYNAGPGRWEDHLSRGRPLPPETVAYMARIGPAISGSAAPSPGFSAQIDRFAWTRASLFARIVSVSGSANPVQDVDELSPRDGDVLSSAGPLNLRAETEHSTAPERAADALFAVRGPR